MKGTRNGEGDIYLFEDMPGGHDESPVVEGVVCVGVRGAHSDFDAMRLHAQSFCRTAKSNILSLSSPWRYI